MSEELKILENRENGSVKISITGEVDIYSSQLLKERLYNIVETEKQDIKIDCEGMNYIDSTGLGVLVGALKKAKESGNLIYITNLKENIKKLFLITGLDKVFIIE
ncbi:MAG TPA: STAS domain-containing protein [Clostridiaceae bacterium]|jgi:anti-sigma B factor antagonist|nr:STAS domain-containing protein [Clostridiaceae bacterium]